MGFEQQHDYGVRSRRGLWGWLRRRELAGVARVTPPLMGLRVWEACAGAGFYSQWLVSLGARVVAVDRCQAMLDQMGEESVEKICRDVRECRPAGFEVAACFGGLEFLPDAGDFFERVSGCRALLLLVPRVCGWTRLYRLYHWLGGQTIYLRSLAELDAAASGWTRRQSCAAGPMSLALRYERA
ncbi:hypothetical protein ABS71_13455 [bacterium SCN 62-11]|nr:MAG: hypothetical protein ABS71_13455 [bacterium SCN 62-11]